MLSITCTGANIDLLNIEDATPHQYQLTGNWKDYGTTITPAAFTTQNFWKNCHSSVGCTAQDFKVSGRNPGPEMIVSAMMTNKQGVSSGGSSKYSDCVIIAKYQNILRTGGKSGDTVNGPLFFGIVMEIRGDSSGETGQYGRAWTCSATTTSQSRHYDIILLRVEGKTIDGHDNNWPGRYDKEFQGVGYPVWHKTLTVANQDETYINTVISTYFHNGTATSPLTSMVTILETTYGWNIFDKMRTGY